MRKVEASLNNTKIHGEYIGISVPAVMNGATLAQSTMTLLVTDKGVDLGPSSGMEDSASPPFKTHFSPSWIFQLKNWEVDHCMSLRQHLNSNLAQLIFDFTPVSMMAPGKNRGFSKRIMRFISSFRRRVRIDSTMFLGEGMHAILGVFLHKGKHSDPETDLLHLYNNVKESFAAEQLEVKHGPVSWLIELNVNIARIVMSSRGNAKEKVEILKKASHNLWTADEKVLKERLAIIAMGMTSSIPEVQTEALNTFVFGGRVTQGVPLLVDFFNREAWNSAVLSRAIKAVTCLLYEAHNHNEKVDSLLKSFGTTDVREIFNISKGVLDPEQADLVRRYADKHPSMKWTPRDQHILRLLLETVLKDKENLTENQEKECLRALKEYPMHCLVG